MASILSYEIPSSAVAIIRRRYLVFCILRSSVFFQTEVQLFLDEANQIRNSSRVIKLLYGDVYTRGDFFIRASRAQRAVWWRGNWHLTLESGYPPWL